MSTVAESVQKPQGDDAQTATDDAIAAIAPANNSTSPRTILLLIAALFLASRALLLLIAAVSANYFQVKSALPGWTDLLCRWDCIWYLSIADIGYSQAEIPQGLFTLTNYSFYPLLPLAIRFLAPAFGGNILYAGLAFTNLCFFVALVYIYRYARLLHYDRRSALTAVALVCCLPQSIAFSALLAESPFLLLLAMAVYHLQRGDYLIAGIAAALLSATRSNGIVFVVFILATLIRSGGLRLFLAPWRSPERFVPLLFAPIGMLAFLGYCFAVTGDAFAYNSAADHGWNWHFYPLWENLPAMLRVGGQSQYAAISGLVTFACALLLLREQRYEEFIFCAAIIVLILSGSGVVSVFRYWIVLFPIWVAVAKVLARRPIVAAITFLSLIVLNALIVGAWVTRNAISL